MLLSKKIKNEIIESLGSHTAEDVEALDETFEYSLREGMRNKYLSHLVAVMEDVGKAVLKNKRFSINFVIKYTLTEEDQKVLSRYYYDEDVKTRKKGNIERILRVSNAFRSRAPHDTQDEDYLWEILYPSSREKDTKEIVQYKRIAIAHELAHFL